MSALPKFESDPFVNAASPRPVAQVAAAAPIPDDFFAQTFGPGAQVVEIAAPAPPANLPAVKEEPAFDALAFAMAQGVKAQSKSTKKSPVDAGVPPEMAAAYIEAKAEEERAIARRKALGRDIEKLAEPALVAHCQRNGKVETTVNLDGGPLNYTRKAVYSDVPAGEMPELERVLGDQAKACVRKKLEAKLVLVVENEDEVGEKLNALAQALGAEDYKKLSFKVKNELTSEFHRAWMLNLGGIRQSLGRVAKPFAPTVALAK